LNILIVHNAVIPALHYGGIERVIWALGKELTQLGHTVKYLVPEGSECHFAQVITLNPHISIGKQIPDDIEVVHCHFPAEIETTKPVVHTIHGNASTEDILPDNSIFVSANHAKRHGSDSFVYNGLDWSEYGTPNLNLPRSYFHFLGNASWKVKNVKGAIETAQLAGVKLKVLGGKRLNLRMGFRFTPNPSISFYSKVNDEEKGKLMSNSRGLVFPVCWHEPFGLAVIESMYFGCPVFATPYGAIPEIVDQSVGFLSNSAKELAYAMKDSSNYSPETCHNYAAKNFNSQKMTADYLKKYETVLNGKKLNESNPRLDPKVPTKFLEWNA
jgi:glycosyltransferase involved in cell wall biosynthesis